MKQTNSQNPNEFTTDSTENVDKGAIKYDGGKPCVYRGLIEYFPRAGTAVAAISTFGAQKYAWKGWEGVPDGINRYSDAMMRHIMAEARGEELDPDSGMLHAAHAAWGALARLELILRKQEEDRMAEIGVLVQDMDEDDIMELSDEEFEELIKWANYITRGMTDAG